MNYLDILLKEYNDIPDDIFTTYFTDNIRTQMMCYFRVFYLYYVITEYIATPKLLDKEIKEVFLEYINKSLNKVSPVNKEIIIKNLNKHYDELFKIFFIDRNLYFHVYFNNLIKYFLPLPYELNTFSPHLTYRNEVQTLYKKNNLDYLSKIMELDKTNPASWVREKNINVPKNEIDLHIPIKNFNEKLFEKLDVIYLIADKYNLYICDRKFKVMYSRKNDFKENQFKYVNNYKKGFALEFLFKTWRKSTDNKIIQINDNISYLSVLKKMTKEDLFNIFKPINFNITQYKYLYHNTNANYNKEEFLDYISRPKFFYLVPSSHSKYFEKDDKHPKCLMVKINKDIKDVLDLTSTIITNNGFTKYLIDEDYQNKKWVSYDTSKNDEYYSNGEIPDKFYENFKCLTKKNLNLKDRPYCDVAETMYYSGRRKLQEVLFKTRKYDISKIWYYEYMKDKYKDIEINDDYLMYHPPNISIEKTRDYEKYILNDLNINGFFFTDFFDAMDGGELMLTKPLDFVDLYKLGDKPCFDTNNKFTEKI